MRALTVWLLCAAILALMVALIPEPPTCYLPPHANLRGNYEKCWTYEEIVI